MVHRDKFAADYRMIVAELVRRRVAAGLSQTELARRLGTAQSQISRLESGERRLDVIDFARLCRALDADAGAILASLPLAPAAAPRPRKRRPRPPSS